MAGKSGSNEKNRLDRKRTLEVGLELKVVIQERKKRRRSSISSGDLLSSGPPIRLCSIDERENVKRPNSPQEVDAKSATDDVLSLYQGAIVRILTSLTAS